MIVKTNCLLLESYHYCPFPKKLIRYRSLSLGRYACLIFKSSDFTDKEAVARRCSVRKVFLKTSQNSQENTCVGVSF